MRWIYKSDTVAGNFHAAAAWLTEHHPEWDVVAMDFVGNYTIIVYRLPHPSEQPHATTHDSDAGNNRR